MSIGLIITVVIFGVLFLYHYIRTNIFLKNVTDATGNEATNKLLSSLTSALGIPVYFGVYFFIKNRIEQDIKGIL
jgi:lipopolysaccharide export system permease protein